MKKMSLKNRILTYLKHNPSTFINGGDIERLSLSAGYKASNGSRRCRELANDGLLERKEEKGSVWYKYIPQQKKIKEAIYLDNGMVRLQDKIIFV